MPRPCFLFIDFYNGVGYNIAMEHVSLYRRYRPSTFDKVIGQNHIVRTLTNQIKTGRVGHAYLFTGSRGTGKTSCAKIFARAVNCLHPVNGSPCGECEVCRALENPGNIDVIEIDAASNNGVDEIRELKENAQYRPTTGRYKVYIIDEVHMLSTAAFNALLKTLEEPPEHVIFILATTEVQKLPQTILSRCMRFDFRLVGKEDLVKHLSYIFGEMGVEADTRALSLIASGGEGCVRDTLSLADMCLSYGGDRITYEDARVIIGSTDFTALDELAGAIADGRTGEALRLTDKLLSAGRTTLNRDLSEYFTDLLTIKNVPEATPDNLTAEQAEKMRMRAEGCSNYRISRIMDIMCSLESAARYSSQPKVLTEAAIVRCCELTTETDLSGLTNRLRELEKKLSDLEAKGVTVRTEPTVPTEKKAVEKKPDVNDLLSTVADEKVELVFEERQPAGEEYLAGDIWGKVLLKLDESNEMMLKMAASCVEGGYKVAGNKFILETADNATVNLFNRSEYHRIMQDLIREVGGKEYDFICVKPAPEKKASAEDKLTLDKLFNGEIKLKPKR